MLLLLAVLTTTQDTTRHVGWSAFVDGYYAYDLGRPAPPDRVFTTQAVRHNEFNINLVYVAATLSGDRIRGRVALQAGTSVQSNYSTEPTSGTVSGSTLSRHIQEATVGARLAQSLWVDGGIYFSYIGLESWISRDNPTYTRSLVADYTPYYLSGVHLTWQPQLGGGGQHRAQRPSAPLTIQLHVMNGWQNISENNSDKAVGARVDWQLSPAVTLAYANFFGNEQPTGTPGHIRSFQQIMAKASLGSQVSVQGQFDYGQEAGHDWYGLVAVGRYAVVPTVAVAGRVERYSDPDQRIVLTGTSDGLVTNGASLGLDVGHVDGVLWRTEVRGLHATARLFPDHGAPDAAQGNLLFVTSLALTLSP